MSGIFLRWGVPAFITVVGGTVAAISTSGAAIPIDLQSRASAQLGAAESSWASVAFDMQDATITGTATTQQMIDDVVAKVAAVHGVRAVTSNVVLAEFVSPFPFIATVAAGELKLTGGLPDENARAQILALAGEGVRDETRLMSGAPDRADWLSAVGFVLRQARDLDEGEVALADLDITISGRAKSPEAYDELTLLAKHSVPPGVNLAFHEVQPALASPFEWHAAFDGKRLELTGSAPDADFADNLAPLVSAGIAVSNRLVLASGAPAAFTESAKSLLQNLLKLEHGSATISDDALSLDGSPADPSTAETIRVAMTPSGARLTLGPPKVSEYWFSAERAKGSFVLDGFVPDAATRDRLEALDNVDAAGLELGRGAPERFASGVDFVLAALGKMSEGHANIQGTVITIEGRASSVGDYTAIRTTLDLGAPQGLILGEASIKPPMATPFTFAVEKTTDGQYALSGYAPSEAIRKAILAAVPKVAVENLTLADGNPDDFEATVLKALAVLPLVDSGRISFDGTSWSFGGAVNTAAKSTAAEAAFKTAGLETAGWTYNVQSPAVVALPIIDPYVWHAQKTPDGTLTMAGFVPTDEVKRYLADHAPTKLVDGTSLGAGAPNGFDAASMAGLDALQAMDSGTIDFAAGNWTLSGETATTADRHSVEKALRAAVDDGRWHVAIQAKDAAPVVTPFVWSAAKAADGTTTLSGYLPTEDLRKAAAAHAGNLRSDTTLVGSGEPDGFDTDVLAGLDALAKLTTGELKYDGRQWSISGQPASQADADAAFAALATTSDRAAGWTQALLEPPVTVPEPTPAEPLVADAPEPAVETPLVETSAPVAEATPDTAPAVVAPAEPEPAKVAETEPVAEPEPVQVVRSYLFDGKKSTGGTLAFAGIVPADSVRLYLASVTGTDPSETLTTGTDLPIDFVADATAGARALVLLSDGEFGLDGEQWVLSGRAENDAERQAALHQLAVAPNARDWQTNVTLVPPLELCERKVGAFAARNAILFQSGSAILANESTPALDELAGYLKACPEATVNVEGHTDSDGEADANLALSVARAEAVVDQLILRSVGPERLYAIGYGESLPVESNDTRAGKQANRRIAFTLADE